MGLALGMALKFNTSVAKELKLKVKKFLGLIPTFVEVTGENLVGVDRIKRRNVALFGQRQKNGVTQQLQTKIF